MKISNIVTAIIFLSLSCLAVDAVATEIELGLNFVNVKKANVRAEPSDKSKIVRTVIRRQLVEVFEVKGDWVRVGRYVNVEGADTQQTAEWVMKKFISKEEPEFTHTEAEAKPVRKYKNKFISEQIVRSENDGGRYFLLYVEKSGSNFITINSRSGKSGDSFTKTEIDCHNQKYRVLGDSFKSVEDINDTPSNWSGLIQGSSKSDLVNYVCGTRYQRRN